MTAADPVASRAVLRAQLLAMTAERDKWKDKAGIIRAQVLGDNERLKAQLAEMRALRDVAAHLHEDALGLAEAAKAQLDASEAARGRMREAAQGLVDNIREHGVHDNWKGLANALAEPSAERGIVP